MRLCLGNRQGAPLKPGWGAAEPCGGGWVGGWMVVEGAGGLVAAAALRGLANGHAQLLLEHRLAAGGSRVWGESRGREG